MFHHAIHLNNEGALLIQKGQSQEAYKKLTLALHQLRDSARLAEAAEQLKGQAPPTAATKKEGKLSLKFLEGALDARAPLDSQFFFLDPLFIDGYPSESAEEHLFSDTTVVLFFNISLAMIYGAVNNGQDCDTPRNQAHELAKATKILESALVTLEREEASSRLSMSIMCALVNNLGQVHRLRQDENASRQWSESLLRMLMFMVVNGEDRNSERHLDVFFGSAMQAVSSTTITTAPCA